MHAAVCVCRSANGGGRKEVSERMRQRCTLEFLRFRKHNESFQNIFVLVKFRSTECIMFDYLMCWKMSIFRFIYCSSILFLIRCCCNNIVQIKSTHHMSIVIIALCIAIIITIGIIDKIFLI